MRILLATMQYGRGYSQGTERYLSLLSAGLRELDHEIAFLAGDPEQRGRTPCRPFEPFERVAQTSRPEPGAWPAADQIFACPATGWLTVAGTAVDDYAAFLSSVRPDVVHLANPGHIGLNLAAAAHRLQIPLVISVVDFWWLCPKHTLLRHDGAACDGNVGWRDCVRCIAGEHERAAIRTLSRVPIVGDGLLSALLFSRGRARGMDSADVQRWKQRQTHTLAALESARKVIFLSETGRRLIGGRMRTQNTVLIRNGLAPPWFAPPATPRRTRPRLPEDLVIGFAGALVPHKGLHLLLAALQSLNWRQARLRIAAAASDAGTYSAELKRLSSGLTIASWQRVALDAMPAFLDEIDLLVVPSVWPENLPMVVAEAYARKTPVIASDVPGIAESVTDRACLFPVGSVTGLADCLENWLSRSDEPAIPRVPTAAEMAGATATVYREAMG